MVKPTVPEFAIEKWAVRPKLFQFGKLFLGRSFITATKINSHGQIRQRTGRNLVRAVRGVKHGFREPCIDEHALDVPHVGVIIAEGAVFVFHLDEQNRTAIANLQRSQFLAEALDPATRWLNIFWIAAADNRGMILQQPRGEPSK